MEGGVAWKWGYIGNLALLGTIAFGLEVFTWIRFFMLKHKQGHKANKNQPEPEAN